MPKKTFATVLSFLVFFLMFFTQNIRAQNSLSGVAVTLSVGGNVQNGSLICVMRDAYVPCSEEYTPRIFGVVTDTPASAMVLSGEEQNSRFILTTGIVSARVSSINGPIAEGDLITSSTVPGIGQRANKNGYVLGSALTSYSNSDPNQSGLVLVSVNIRPAVSTSSYRGNLIEALRQGTYGFIFDPITSLRYLLAVGIVLSAFGLGFLYFGRVATKGIDALGRNPLAGKLILKSVLLNVLIMLGTVAVGLGTAYFILIY